NNSVLEYIPSDTPILFAQLKPYSAVELMKGFEDNGVYTVWTEEMANDLKPLRHSTEPNLVMAYHLIEPLLEHLGDPAKLFELTGMADNQPWYVYSIGLIPVSKAPIANETVFWQYIDTAAEKANVSYETATLEGHSYRRYKLSNEVSSQYADHLIVSVRDGMATMTLEGDALGSTTAMALGFEKPTSSLANSDILSELTDKYPLAKNNIGYIDFQRIVGAVTMAEDSALNRHLVAVAQDDRGTKSMLADFGSDACSTDLNSVAANWPRLVIGQEVDVSAGEVSTQITLETHNQVILGALQSLQGHIPDYVGNKDNLFSMALGIDAGNIASAVTTIVEDLQQPSYRCERLADIQGHIAREDISKVHIITPFVTGLKGFSMALFAAEEESFDAMAAFSADDVGFLIDIYQAFEPELAALRPAINGETIDITNELAHDFANQSVFAKGSTSHLALFSGEHATRTVETLDNKLTPSDALLQITFDYAPLYDLYASFTDVETDSRKNSRSAPPVPEFPRINTRDEILFGFDDNGITLQSTTQF
uniref:hypothetical protein n=1 Tax=Thaumasiovibrio occultus TaxID=1891184 RepID=UPI000B34E393